VVRAVVPAISNLVEAHGRDGGRAWASDFGQLHLALGSGCAAQKLDQHGKWAS